MLGKSSLLAATLAALLAGCAAPRATVQLQSPFDEQRARDLLADGTNTVKGSALLRQVNGGVVTCAGNEVTLIPATMYARERQASIYGPAIVTSSMGPPSMAQPPFPLFVPDVASYQQLAKKTRCDAQGFFRFERVASGEFFVTTHVTWRVSEYRIEGGALSKLVAVSDGSTADIVLTSAR